MNDCALDRAQRLNTSPPSLLGGTRDSSLLGVVATNDASPKSFVPPSKLGGDEVLRFFDLVQNHKFHRVNSAGISVFGNVGKEQSATLGHMESLPDYPERVAQQSVVEPFQGSGLRGHITRGSSQSLATLGCKKQPPSGLKK